MVLVVLNNRIHPGSLLVLESGFCVVRDCITLQLKRQYKRSQRMQGHTRTETPKLWLDTQVATLGPTTILFAEEVVSCANSSSQSLHRIGEGTSNLPEGEYVVAESPVVSAFWLELYPRTSVVPPPGPSFRQNHDLLVVALLGRSGLQTVRTAITAQRNRRAKHVGNSVRLAEAAAAEENNAPLISPRASPLKRVLNQNNDDAPGKQQHPPLKMELLHYLRDRQLPKGPKLQSTVRTSIELNPLMGPPVKTVATPTKFSGLSLGSFVKSSRPSNSEDIFPALRSVGHSDYSSEHGLQAYMDPAVVAASMRRA
jgi:hypothetical protein